MARDVTFQESIILDEMLAQYDVFEVASEKLGSGDELYYDLSNKATANVMLLLGCIKKFRMEPQSTPVEDCCGAMADKEAK